MARPRGPVERKRLHGRSATKDAAGRPLPAPVTVLPAPEAIPPPPDTLEESGWTHWGRVWVQARQWLCGLDYDAVQRYCETLDCRDAMIGAVKIEGVTAVGSKGSRSRIL